MKAMVYKLRSILLPHIMSEVIILIFGTIVWHSKIKQKSSVGQAVLYSLPHIFKRGKVVEKAIGVKQSNCIIV